MDTTNVEAQDYENALKLMREELRKYGSPAREIRVIDGVIALAKKLAAQRARTLTQ